MSNNRSYTALLIPDIQQSICQHLARVDQVQVARLSKAFTHIALNAIYHKMTSLVGIFRILGEMEASMAQEDDVVPFFRVSRRIDLKVWFVKIVAIGEFAHH